MINKSKNRIRISINKKGLKSFLDIPIFIEKDNGMFVAGIPLFNIGSQGKTKKQALKRLKDACDSYFSSEDIEKVLMSRLAPPKISVNIMKDFKQPQTIKI